MSPFVCCVYMQAASLSSAAPWLHPLQLQLPIHLLLPNWISFSCCSSRLCLFQLLLLLIVSISAAAPQLPLLRLMLLPIGSTSAIAPPNCVNCSCCYPFASASAAAPWLHPLCDHIRTVQSIVSTKLHVTCVVPFPNHSTSITHRPTCMKF